jgi:hypothetical protein
VITSYIQPFICFRFYCMDLCLIVLWLVTIYTLVLQIKGSAVCLGPPHSPYAHASGQVCSLAPSPAPIPRVFSFFA